MTDWKWRGLPGHFCAAAACQFHLCTDIGQYRISTVGAYLPPSAKQLQEIGCGRHYETMVFKIGERDQIIPRELDMKGIEIKNFRELEKYVTLAEQMHIRMCEKWEKIA